MRFGRDDFLQHRNGLTVASQGFQRIGKVNMGIEILWRLCNVRTGQVDSATQQFITLGVPIRLS